MANSVKGDAVLKLSDGREYLLVLDMEAMLCVEDNMGKPLPQVMKMANEEFMSAVAGIAQAAFVRHHPDVTRAEVLDILRTDSAALERALAAATEAAFPKEKPQVGNAVRGKKPPQSKSSGRSGAKPV